MRKFLTLSLLDKVKQGVKWYGARFAVVGSVVYVTSLLPQTLGMNQLRQLIALYDFEDEVKLSPHLERITGELVDVASQTWGAGRASKIQFFMANQQDPIHQGSVASGTGAIIGVPGFFNYHKASDVETHRLGHGLRKFNFMTDVGKLYTEAVVLSDNAQKFGIMREMNYSNSHWLHVRGILAGISAGFAFSSAYEMSLRILRLKPALRNLYRGIVFGGIGIASVCFYIVSLDFYNRICDKAADRKTIDMGPAFFKGAEEFYSKQVERNMAMRKLLGSLGREAYSYDGNLKLGYLRTPHVPITKRLALVRKYGAKKYRNISTDNEILKFEQTS